MCWKPETENKCRSRWKSHCRRIYALHAAQIRWVYVNSPFNSYIYGLRMFTLYVSCDARAAGSPLAGLARPLPAWPGRSNITSILIGHLCAVCRQRTCQPRYHKFQIGCPQNAMLKYELTNCIQQTRQFCRMWLLNISFWTANLKLVPEPWQWFSKLASHRLRSS